MNILMHYPSRCVSRPLPHPNEFKTNPRGLTGSEEAFLQYAQQLGQLGHTVSVVSNFGAASGAVHQFGMTGSVTYMDELQGTPEQANAARDASVWISWMVPDLLKYAPAGVLRIYNQQCSDFAMCDPGWEQHVDVFCPLSRSHLQHMRPQAQLSMTCRVMPNGCWKPDTIRTSVKKVSGSAVWASSHDRGLHHLLSMWPACKKLVPHATLDVFYDRTGMDRFAENQQTGTAWIDELTRRSAYSREALLRLERLGVRMHGSASRQTVQDAFARSSVLAYPCDPVRYTETFGSTVLEAMSHGCIPILCLSDAFAELWGEPSLAVYPPFAETRGVYEQMLTTALAADETRLGVFADKCREHSLRYHWPKLGIELLRMIESKGAQGFEAFQ